MIVLLSNIGLDLFFSYVDYYAVIVCSFSGFRCANCIVVECSDVLESSESKSIELELLESDSRG